MGRHCAANMLKKFASLTVYDVSEQAVQELVAQGAEKASSAAGLAKKSDVIFFCVPNIEVVEKLLFGAEGLGDAMRPGLILVDLSTCDFIKTREIASKVEGSGADFLDSPISGMEARAKSGELSLMCGGREEVFKKIHPYLEAIGSSILYMGPHGLGQFSKTVNNILYNINMAGLAEILPYAVKMGLPPEKVGQFVNAGTGRSYASEYFIPRILEGDFSYGFTMESAYKDMRSACEESARSKIPTPVLHAAMTTYQMALLEGYGNDYKGGMIKVYERLLGVAFRRQETR
jgi:3-hydroxyisobutyrate dehydrogenase-like beta-hydroxyacid dehydrogenase